MPANGRWFDGEDVFLEGPVAYASYNRIGEYGDVTAQVNGLVNSGRTHITGGIHNAIGDPAPGEKKCFQVWYLAKPSQMYQDGVHVTLQTKVVAASYGPAGQHHEVKDAVNHLIHTGRTEIDGGIHTVLGDNFPGQPKVFSVWYE